jgi:HK97 family phage major capsid protein
VSAVTFAELDGLIDLLHTVASPPKEELHALRQRARREDPTLFAELQKRLSATSLKTTPVRGAARSTTGGRRSHATPPKFPTSAPAATPSKTRSTSAMPTATIPDTAARASAELRAFIATGERATRAQGIGTGLGGGYAAPVGFWAKVQSSMTKWSAVRSVAEVITTASGSDLLLPLDDDSSTSLEGAQVSENSLVPSVDLLFGQALFKSWLWSSGIQKVSLQLALDIGVDLEGYLSRRLGRRIGRGQNRAFTVGTGSGQPQGLISGGRVGATAAGASAITAADLTALVASVDPAYRDQEDRCVFMMSGATFAVVRELVTTNSQPVWARETRRLLDFRVVLNDHMDSIATGKRAVAFGDLESGYAIRDAGQFVLLRLDERFADLLEVGMIGFARSDGAIQDPKAYAVLQQP